MSALELEILHLIGLLTIYVNVMLTLYVALLCTCMLISWQVYLARCIALKLLTPDLLCCQDFDIIMRVPLYY